MPVTRPLARALCGAALVFSGGCSGGDGILDMFDTPTPAPGPGGGSITGTIGGQTIDVRSAVSTIRFLEVGFPTGVVILSDATSVCDVFSAGYQPYGAQYLYIDLVEFIGAFSHTPTTPGEFAVSLEPTLQPRQAYGGYTRMGTEQCNFSPDVIQATGGAVTLTSVGAGFYQGFAVLTTELGDDVGAAFNPIVCPAAANMFDPGLLPCL